MDIEHALSQVQAAHARVDESQEALAAAKQALQRTALQALLAVDGDDGRQRDLVRRLYWEVPAVPVNAIEVVVGSAARVRKLARPGPLVGACDVCGADVQATTRTQLAKGHARCPGCVPEPVVPPQPEVGHWPDDDFEDFDLLWDPPPP
jgi:hypothetical protein